MNLNASDVAGVVAYFVLTGVFAYLVRRTRSFSDFSVGSRNIPGLLVFASLAATFIGPGFSIGFTAEGYGRGYVFYILALTYPLQMVVVAFCVAPRLSRFRDCHTLGDVMAKRYGRFTQLLAGIVSVGLCIGFTAVMGKAGGHLLQSVTGIGAGTWWGLDAHIAFVTLCTAGFTFSGGVRAVISTDSMHFVWVSIIVPIVLMLAYFRYSGSPDELWLQGRALTTDGFAGLSGVEMFAIALSFLLGETLIPPYANRALAARTPVASKGGFLMAAMYCAVWLAIVASLGVVAHKFVPPETGADDVFLKLGQVLLPAGAYGLLVGAGIAIVMSSQESVLNSAAVSFTRDIAVVVKPSSESSALLLSRVATVGIAVVATIAASGAPTILQGLMICYSIWAPSMLIPLIAALYLKRTRPIVGWLSMTAGGTTALAWQVLGQPFGYPAILVGLAASATGYLVGSAVGIPQRKSRTYEGEISQ